MQARLAAGKVSAIEAAAHKHRAQLAELCASNLVCKAH